MNANQHWETGFRVFPLRLSNLQVFIQNSTSASSENTLDEIKLPKSKLQTWGRQKKDTFKRPFPTAVDWATVYSDLCIIIKNKAKKQTSEEKKIKSPHNLSEMNKTKQIPQLPRILTPEAPHCPLFVLQLVWNGQVYTLRHSEKVFGILKAFQ